MALFDQNLTMVEETIPIKELLPSRYFEGEDGVPNTLWVEALQEVFNQLTNDIRNLGNIYNLDETDERYLDLIIRNLAFDLKVSLSISKKRKLAKVIINAYKQKGTCPGIENTIRQFTGVDAQCFPFTVGWILDQSLLGVDTYLNPAPENAAGFYTFDVIVNVKLSQEQRRVILDLIELIKPAHSHFRSLIELGADAFVLSVQIMLNRASLYLWREQNDDGGWDASETDDNPVNVSAIVDVGYHGVAQRFADAFVNLPNVNTSFRDAVQKLIDDATYVFSGVRPRDSDILLLNRGELASPIVTGAGAKRDEALEAIGEFAKALAFLNNFNATNAEVAATTIAERNATTLAKRAQFLYLRITNDNPLGEGIYRYVRFMRDYIEVGNEPFAQEMASQLFLRTTSLPLDSAFGQHLLLANASIVYGLQLFNEGLVYETLIAQSLSIIDANLVPAEKLYLNTFYGAGSLESQAMILDAFMLRNRFDQAKTLIDGLRLKQRIDGSVDDPINPGTAFLRGLATVVDSVSRAIKRMDDEGI